MREIAHKKEYQGWDVVLDGEVEADGSFGNPQLTVSKLGEDRVYDLYPEYVTGHLDDGNEYLHVYTESKKEYIVKLEDGDFLVIDIWNSAGEAEEFGAWVFGEDNDEG